MTLPTTITFTPEKIAEAAGLDVTLVRARMEEGVMPAFDRDGGWSADLVNDVLAGLARTRKTKIAPAASTAFTADRRTATPNSRRVRSAGDRTPERAPSAPDDIETFLGARRICAIFGWSRSTLYRKIKDGSFPAADFAVSGSHSKWAKSTVQTFIEEGKVRAAA